MIATAENVQGNQGKLPPSVRDFEIYQCAALQGHSTRDTAFRFGLSQTRVRQVLARVVEFLVQAVPGELPERSKEQRLYVAEQLARMHLEHLYGQALAMWEHSKSETRENPAALGKICYLSVAARIVSVMAKVPVHELPQFRTDPDETQAEDDYDRLVAEFAKLPDKPDDGTDDPNERCQNENPPVRDCSAEPVSREPASQSDSVVSNTGDATCNLPSDPREAARRDFFAPAHPAAEAPDSLACEPPPADPLYSAIPSTAASEKRERRCCGRSWRSGETVDHLFRRGACTALGGGAERGASTAAKC